MTHKSILFFKKLSISLGEVYDQIFMGTRGGRWRGG